jgi:hypothetical protein
VECQPDRYDLLIALDWQKLDQFANDRAAATAAVLADDGYTLGLLFRGQRALVPGCSQPFTTLDNIERQLC